MIQYTVRGIPAKIDARLRRLARLRGESLNQTIINQLSSSPGQNSRPHLHSKKPHINKDFDDLFGAITPLDPEVESALRAQRVINPKDW